LQFEGSWGYKGLLKIDAKVTRATKEIVLNSKEIVVQTAEVLGKDGSCVKSLWKRTECAFVDKTDQFPPV
jgi:hypothetical protein